MKKHITLLGLFVFALTLGLNLPSGLATPAPNTATVAKGTGANQHAGTVHTAIKHHPVAAHHLVHHVTAAKT